MPSARPSASNPGPRLALEAGTRRQRKTLSGRGPPENGAGTKRDLSRSASSKGERLGALGIILARATRHMLMIPARIPEEIDYEYERLQHRGSAKPQLRNADVEDPDQPHRRPGRSDHFPGGRIVQDVPAVSGAAAFRTAEGAVVGQHAAGDRAGNPGNNGRAACFNSEIQTHRRVDDRGPTVGVHGLYRVQVSGASGPGLQLLSV